MQLQQLWDEWDRLNAYAYKSVREKIRGTLARRGVFPNRSDLEELTQEGIAFCWRYFRELRPKSDNAQQAILVAAKQAARAVSRGERFVADQTRQKSVATRADVDLDSLPTKAETERTSDYSKAERIISALPDRLRGVARLLAYGDTVETIAHKHHKHRKTIERNVREMRDHVSLIYWRICNALLSALH